MNKTLEERLKAQGFEIFDKNRKGRPVGVNNAGVLARAEPKYLSKVIQIMDRGKTVYFEVGRIRF